MNQHLSPKTFAIISFGCKVNQEEAEQLSALFAAQGWQQAAPEREPSLYIVNTCTVTQVADKKARAVIRRLRREYPNAVLAVTGCYAQTAADIISTLDVDIVAGLHERARLPQLAEERLLWRRGEQRGEQPAGQRAQPLVAVADIGAAREFAVIGPAARQKRARAYLKIEDGCDQFCHYCIIPYARGPVRSLPPEQAVTQARQLLEAGHQELVLSGIHIGAYGQDLPPGQDLPALLEGILGLSENFRLRLGSIEPRQFSTGLKSLIAREPRICPHLHIPLQSGCDRTLAAMGRDYTSAGYAALLAELRALKPGLAVTTDVMVGYPGETEEDFAASLAFCEQAGFAKMHVFPYSRRPGTVAADLAGQVAQKEKTRRAALMGETAVRLEQAYARGFIGATVDYLYEQELELAGRCWYAGHSGNYLPLALPAEDFAVSALLAEDIAVSAPPPGLTPVRALEFCDGYLLCEREHRV